MTPFLKQIAGHYHAQGDMEKRCFILPNRRAMVFFRKYLGDFVHEDGTPMICPQLFTIDDFFVKLSGQCRADRIQLLIELYDCYTRLRPNPEPIDEFISWGEMILSDFNDVDKYLVDPRSILMNVYEFKQMLSPLEYMTETQLEAMRRFVSNFDELRGTKREFLRNWEILYPLYEGFGASLRDKGIAYDGQIYRDVALRLDEVSVVDMLSDAFPDVTGYVFVGLNALNECEKKLIGRMVTAGVAECCWDFSSDMIRDEANRASHFLRENISRFGQAVHPDSGPLPETAFNVVSVPSSVGQAKQIPQILSMMGVGSDLDTAVVLPDEDLLIPVINSIPEDVRSVNITMGYPMSGSQLYALMKDIASLQLTLREKDGTVLFYHKPLWAILSNSIIRSILPAEDREAIETVKSEHRYYVRQDALDRGVLLSAIFRKAGPRTKSYLEYQKRITAMVGGALKACDGLALEMDFAMEYYKSLLRMESYSLDLRPATWFRLVEQLVHGLSVPFRGEPLRGLQIMGPLETRALDFDNVIILSCNEGLFPRHSVASSFIPAELRKGFGLPTYEYQDSVWAYYFYRLIQRASNVWMLYDSRAEMSRSGEESRYIKQLELHFCRPIRRYVVKSPVSPGQELPPIAKTEEILGKLRDVTLSATSLQHYLSCPAMFYYETVCTLRQREDVSESLDRGMLGDVFHKTMQQIYDTGDGLLHRDCLLRLKADKEAVRTVVARNIMEKLGTSEVEGRNIIFEDMVCRYVLKTISRDIELMDRNHTDRIEILGLELKLEDNIGGFRFKGYVDRLDSVSADTVRIVDYKTGQVKDEDLAIDESNAESVVDAIFGDDDSRRPKIALQLYLYDTFLRHSRYLAPKLRGRRLVNSIYQTRRLYVESVSDVELCGSFMRLMDERLGNLLSKIVNPQEPFERSGNGRTCSMCNFKSICGR